MLRPVPNDEKDAHRWRNGNAWKRLGVLCIWHLQGDAANNRHILRQGDLGFPRAGSRNRNGVYDFKIPSSVTDAEKKRVNRDDDPSKLYDRYVSMHDLQRHVIHMDETLSVAVRTMKSVAEGHRARECDQNENRLNCKETRLDFEFSGLFLESLQARAESFEQRLSNEMHLVCLRQNPKLIL